MALVVSGASRSLSFTPLAATVWLWRRGSNGGLADLGEQGVLLVDTGADEVTAAALLAATRQWLGRRLWVVHTHHHPDHTYATGALARTAGAVVWDPRGGAAAGRGPGPGDHPDVDWLPLPGDTAESIGIRTGSVLWTGDAVYA